MGTGMFGSVYGWASEGSGQTREHVIHGTVTELRVSAEYVIGAVILYNSNRVCLPSS